MTSYKIVVEDMKCQNCARTIKKALEDNGCAVTVNVAKKEVYLDTDLSVADVYQIIEDAGFTPTDLDLM